jgi:hypothetical protein
MAAEDPTQTKTQIIDPEIAKILGLEDNFDLEYDEYMTLMKEAIAKGAFDEKLKLSEEDLAKIANERKRIRDLKESTFTTAPKKTVNVDSFFGRRNREQNKPTDSSKLLAGSPEAIKASRVEPIDDIEDQKDNTVDKLYKFLNGDLLSIVKEIRSLTEDIVNIFKKQSQANEKSREKNRIEKNKQKKAGKENKLESKKQSSKGSKLLDKVRKPFTNIFDTIKNFIMMVLLGSAVNWLFSVIKNPKILLQPIQDLFDGIVGVFNSILQFIDNKLIQPVRGFIDSINSAISGFIDMINGALKFIPGAPQLPNDPDKGVIPNIPKIPELQAPDIVGNREPEPAEPQQKQQSAPGVNVKFNGGSITKLSPVLTKNTGGSITKLSPVLTNNTGGSITKLSPVLTKNMGGSTTPPQRKTPTIGNDTVSIEGGVVNNNTVNTKISGLGPDQYLTALSLGEYVLKPGAVNWLGGEEYLDKVNYMFGGRSERRTASIGDINIEAMNTGGSVGGRRNDAHKGGGSSTTTPTQNAPKDETKQSESKGSIEYKLKKSDPPNNAPKVETKEGRQLIPDEYVKNTKHTTHIKVGDKEKKNYVIRYEKTGDTYIVKQINKLVQSSFLGLNDKFTGVNPQSPEGKLVTNSIELKNWFNDYDNMSLLDSKKIKIESHKDADLWFWYSRSYKANYDYWKKLNVTEKEARIFAAKAAAEFAMPGKNKDDEGVTLMPGADNPAAAPEHLRTVAVDSDNTSSSSSSSSSTQAKYDPNFKIEGGKVKQFYLDALADGSYTGKRNISSSSASNFISNTNTTNNTTNNTNNNTNNIKQLVRGMGGSGSSILDPTKTAASMPHVFEAAKEARAKARAEGLSPEEVEKRVIVASENAKRNGPSFKSLTPTSSQSNQPRKTLLQTTFQNRRENRGSSYTPPTQPQITPTKTPTIPSIPQSRSSTTIIPMPGGENQSKTMKTGMTKTGTTSIPTINSFDDNQQTMVTVAAIYNIWGM